MGTLVVGINITAQPLPGAAAPGFGKGIVTARASASGTGTWSARFNYAPVGGWGDVGAVAYLDVSNATPMAEFTAMTGSHAFIGWWSNIAGSVSPSSVGTLEG